MINVKVSATSANIGAGFDCMGLALNLYNELTVEASDKFEIITDKGLPSDKSNLVYSSMEEVFKMCGSYPTIKLKQINRIPVASGLGSSAACIVAGVTAANELLDRPLSESDIINLCTRLDGHPDNIVPAVIGGITAGVFDKGKVEYIKCHAPENLAVAAMTPDFELHTSVSRSVLPEFYSRSDVVFSLQRAIVTFAALVNGDIDKLKVIDDKLHQPYRIPLIKGYDDITKLLKSNGAIASFISGAGPTILGFFLDAPKLTAPSGWTFRSLNIVNSGVQIINEVL